MLAVAQVLANRVKAGWHGGDWMSVIENAPNHVGTVVHQSHKVSAKDLGFRDLLRKIDDVYYGVADDSNVNQPEASSLYYAQLNKVNRQWFRLNILDDLENHPRLAQVGPLTFFG